MYQLDQWIENIIDNALKPENFNSALTQNLSQNNSERSQDLIHILSMTANLLVQEQTNQQVTPPYKNPELVKKIEVKADEILATTIDNFVSHYSKYTWNPILKRSTFLKYLECIEASSKNRKNGSKTTKITFILEDSQIRLSSSFNGVRLSDLRQISVLAPVIAELKLPNEKQDLHPYFFEHTPLQSIDELVNQISTFLIQLKADYLQWRTKTCALERSQRKSVIFNSAILLASDINQVKVQQTVQLDKVVDNFNYRLKIDEINALDCITATSPLTHEIDDLARYFESEIQNFHAHESLR